MNAWTQHTPIGPMTLAEEDGALTHALFGKNAPEAARRKETAVITQAFSELEAYFRGGKAGFSVPLKPRGTPFQLRCWQALREIPYGQTRTYAQQAQAVGSPRAYRAVGMANHHNPLPVFIPCHRVVGTNGRLTGYGGGLEIKKKLLEIENAWKG